MWRSLITAFGFLSRIPVPFVQVDNRVLGGALAYFPVVGVVLGAVLFGVSQTAARFSSPLVTAFIITVVWAWITGGLHLDGLADTFDGLGGGRGDRTRALSIMRDSRIGTHGAVALILVLVGKVILTASLVGTHMLWLIPLAARAAIVPAIAWLPYARPDGLGRAMHEHARVSGVVLSQAFLVMGLLWLGLHHWPVAAAAYGVTALVAMWLTRKLGGLTGDTYGACIELAELAALLAAQHTQ